MTLALIAPGRSFTANFVTSMVDTISYCMAHRINVRFSGNGAANIYTARTGALTAGAQEIPPKVLGHGEYDYALLVDSDMVWTPGDIEKLLGLDVDVAVGIYIIGLDGSTSVGWERKDGSEVDYLHWMKDEMPEEAFKIDVAGLGFTLVKKGVVESLDWPWLHTEVHPVSRKPLSEDLVFFRDVRKKGFDVWCHPEVLLGHEKQWPFYPTVKQRNG